METKPISLDCTYSFSRMITEATAYQKMVALALSDIYWDPRLTMRPIKESGKHNDMMGRAERYRKIREIMAEDLPEKPIRRPANMRPDWDYRDEL
jgi:hypothetical protein